MMFLVKAEDFSLLKLNATPVILTGSLLLVQVAQIFLLILFEKVDYDTFTYYFSKVELMRFWTPSNHPVMSFVQEYLPIGYSKFQKLFASGLYARNAGNYLIVAAVAAYLCIYVRRLWLPLAFLALTNVAFFTQYVGYKTDAPLAALSVLLLHLISRHPFPLQVTASVLIVGVILSIKWTGGLVILPALAIFLWRVSMGRASISLFDAISACVTTVILANWLELGIYLDTFIATGSFVPTETFGVGTLKMPDPILLAGNLLKYITVAGVETFEPIWRRLLDYPAVGYLIENITLGAKTNVIMNTNEIYVPLNIFDALGMIACVLVLRSNNAFVTSCAVTAIFYYVISLSVVYYLPAGNRYYLPAQIISYVPLAYLGRIMYQRLSRRIDDPLRSRLALGVAAAVAIFHLCTTGGMILFDKERNLLPNVDTPLVSTQSIKERTVALDVRNPIYREDAVAQLFRGWLDYQLVYRAMQQKMSSSDDLEVIFDSSANDTDYNYPFLRHREAANTKLTNIRGVPNADVRLASMRVLCFGKRACSLKPPDYEEVRQVSALVAFWTKR